MGLLHIIDDIISVLFFLIYFYQFIYMFIPFILGKKKIPKSAPQDHDFAVLICARDEENVIGDLIDCIAEQTYDQSKIHVFLIADNCSDRTAEIAREHGAVVYERENKELVGKGYALQALLQNLKKDYAEGFDGYFVFDADNLLKPDFIEQMNNTFSEGHDIITCYRNSKNFSDTWVSATSTLFFLRENRFLNHSRYLLGTSCNVSGTGFFFSRKVAEEIKDWPFHMLTEDIEFTMSQVVQDKKIAFCDKAELYDEQPQKFSQSWKQRIRWSRGNLQAIRYYGGRLFKGIFRGNFACFDMLMFSVPAIFLSLFSVIVNLALTILGIILGANFLVTLTAILKMLLYIYGSFFLIGWLVVIKEWKRIRAKGYKKILSVFAFPIFMASFIPISLISLFKRVKWERIEHSVSAEDFKQDQADT